MHDFIDYSQYKTWTDCEYKWVERYLRGMRREPKPGQKDDAQTVGSLTHAGLQALRLTGKPDIPDEAIAKYTPTPEALTAARSLLLGYIRAYPGEQDITDRYFCEDPLRFPLPRSRWQGLAKIDSYFLNKETRTIPDGLGSVIGLSPGWWVHEYKTKDASRDVGKYVMGWRMNMQPSFQMLALANQIGVPIQGVIVNVLERTKPYHPKRTCKGCKKQTEFRDWIPAARLGENVYTCPECYNTQVLEVPEAKIVQPNKYYRLAVQRNEDELVRDITEIDAVAQRMEQLVAGTTPIRATERCVDSVWGPCEYFDPHSSNRPASDWRGFINIEATDYVTSKT